MTYPSNWKEISHRVRFERENGICQHCNKEHLSFRESGSRVIIATAHKNHDTADNRNSNLIALCQKCHLKYDKNYHTLKRNVWKLETSVKFIYY